MALSQLKYSATASPQNASSLTTTPPDAEAIDVFVDAVIQVARATENFTLSNNILTLNDAVQQGGEVIAPP